MVDLIATGVGWLVGRALTSATGRTSSAVRRSMGRSRVRGALERVIGEAAESATEQTCADRDEAVHVRRLLVERSTDDWPLIDGSELSDLAVSVRSWVSEAFWPIGSDGTPEDRVPADDPLVVALCTAIVEGIRHDAVYADEPALDRLWNEFQHLTTRGELSERERPHGTGWRPWWEPPLTAAGFVGRADALARLADEPGRLVLIHGVGGVGKTALAVAHAERVSERYPDGLLFLDFGSYAERGTELSAEQALRVLLRRTAPLLSKERIDGYDLETLRSTWRATVGGRRVLMVWDNVADPAQIEPLLIREPGCATIVTSRADLRLAECSRLSLDVLSEDDATALFAHVAGAGSGAAEDEHLVRRLVRADLHLPLLIEHHARSLAAPGSASLTAETVHELEHLATEPTRDRLRECLEHSVRRLSAGERRTLVLLGAHPAGILTAGTAAHLHGRALDNTIGSLDGLVAAGLVHRHSGRRPVAIREFGTEPANHAYSAHDVILEFATALARRQGEAESVASAIRDYYAKRLEDPADLGWLDAEWECVLAVVLAGRDIAHADLGLTAGPQLIRVGAYAEAIRVFRHCLAVYADHGVRGDVAAAWLHLTEGSVAQLGGRALDAARLYERADLAFEALGLDQGRATVLQSRGLLAIERHELDAAEALYREAAEIFVGLGDRLGQAESVNGRAMVAVARGDYPRAEEYFRLAVDLHDDSGRREHARVGLADALRMQGRYVEAREELTAAVEACERTQDIAVLAGALIGLGDTERLLGGYAEGRAHSQRADRLFEIVDGTAGRIEARLSEARIALLQGDYPASERLCRTAAEWAEGIGDSLRRASAHVLLAGVLLRTGGLEPAERLYRDAIATLEGLGDRRALAEALSGLGTLAWRTDRFGEAAEHLGRAVDLYRGLGERAGLANALVALGDLARFGADPATAAGCYAEARQVSHETGDRGNHADALWGLGDLARARGDLDTAEWNYSAAKEIYDELGSQLGIAQSLAGMGDVAVGRGYAASARDHYRRAAELFAELGDDVQFENVTRALAQLDGAEPRR